MATTKISITIDSDRLDELKTLAENGVSLSAVIDEAVRKELNRLRMLEVLAEMERENPISDEGERAGEELWQRIKSSWTPEPSPPSRKKRNRSAALSKKR